MIKNFYSLNKKCDCGDKIANQNKTGMCRSCYKTKFNIENKSLIKSYKRNKIKDKISNAIYYSKNKDKIKVYEKERYKTNIQNRLRRSLRSRLWHALKRKAKTGSAVADLSCSINQLKSHLESLFQPGMTWDNYGQWHIDHKVPLCSFNLSNREDFLKACHYENLQPLWAEDNLKKSHKV